MYRGKALRLACWNADSVRGRELELEHFLNPGEAFRLVNNVCRRKDRQQGRYSHPGPSWYSATLSARSGPDPLGGYCHSSHIGRQSGEKLCGLPFAFLPADRSGSNRLFRREVAGPDG